MWYLNYIPTIVEVEEKKPTSAYTSYPALFNGFDATTVSPGAV